MDFRPLFEEMFEWRSTRSEPSFYDEYLLPWLDAHQEHVAWLREFGERSGNPVPAAEAEDRWDLYSISRVQDILLAASQPALAKFDATSDYTFYSGYTDRWNLTPAQHLSFMVAL
jgi:hypothetical protein